MESFCIPSAPVGLFVYSKTDFLRTGVPVSEYSTICAWGRIQLVDVHRSEHLNRKRFFFSFSLSRKPKIYFCFIGGDDGCSFPVHPSWRIYLNRYSHAKTGDLFLLVSQNIAETQISNLLYGTPLREKKCKIWTDKLLYWA